MTDTHTPDGAPDNTRPLTPDEAAAEYQAADTPPTLAALIDDLDSNTLALVRTLALLKREAMRAHLRIDALDTRVTACETALQARQ